MKNDKLGFAERLRTAMEQAGHPPRAAVLEREFNTRYWGRSVTLQAVRRWLRGEAIPSQDKLLVLAEWLKVEPHELRYGTRVSRTVQDYRARWGEGLHAADRETLDAYLELPADQRRFLREVILRLHRLHQLESGSPP